MKSVTGVRIREARKAENLPVRFDRSVKKNEMKSVVMDTLGSPQTELCF